MHETFEFMQGWSGGVWVEGCVGVGGVILCILCVCVPISQCCKECFCRSKGSLGSFCFFFFYFCFFPSSSILPHTFEPLCGIVPWSWLGSLLPRPLLPPGQLAHTPHSPPRSDAASRGTAQRQGLQKALKPGEPELLLPQFRTGRVGGRGWHVFSQQRASKWMRIGVYVWSSEVSLCPLPPLSTGLTVRLSARDPASYLRLRQCRGKSSAKRSPAGEGDDANLPSPLTWSRGSSLKDSVSRIHGSGAGNTSRDGGRAKERGVDGEV